MSHNDKISKIDGLRTCYEGVVESRAPSSTLVAKSIGPEAIEDWSRISLVAPDDEDVDAVGGVEHDVRREISVGIDERIWLSQNRSQSIEIDSIISIMSSTRLSLAENNHSTLLKEQKYIEISDKLFKVVKLLDVDSLREFCSALLEEFYGDYEFLSKIFNARDILGGNIIFMAFKPFLEGKMDRTRQLSSIEMLDYLITEIVFIKINQPLMINPNNFTSGMNILHFCLYFYSRVTPNDREYAGEYIVNIFHMLKTRNSKLLELRNNNFDLSNHEFYVNFNSPCYNWRFYMISPRTMFNTCVAAYTNELQDIASFLDGDSCCYPDDWSDSSGDSLVEDSRAYMYNAWLNQINDHIICPEDIEDALDDIEAVDLNLHFSSAQDISNLLKTINILDKEVVYYAGFSFIKGEYSSKKQFSIAQKIHELCNKPIEQRTADHNLPVLFADSLRYFHDLENLDFLSESRWKKSTLSKLGREANFQLSSSMYLGDVSFEELNLYNTTPSFVPLFKSPEVALKKGFGWSMPKFNGLQAIDPKYKDSNIAKTAVMSDVKPRHRLAGFLFVLRKSVVQHIEDTLRMLAYDVTYKSEFLPEDQEQREILLQHQDINFVNSIRLSDILCAIPLVYPNYRRQLDQSIYNTVLSHGKELYSYYRNKYVASVQEVIFGSRKDENDMYLGGIKNSYIDLAKKCAFYMYSRQTQLIDIMSERRLVPFSVLKKNKKLSEKFDYYMCLKGDVLRDHKYNVEVEYFKHEDNNIWVDKIKILSLAVLNSINSNLNEKFYECLINIMYDLEDVKDDTELYKALVSIIEIIRQFFFKNVGEDEQEWQEIIDDWQSIIIDARIIDVKPITCNIDNIDNIIDMFVAGVYDNDFNHFFREIEGLRLQNFTENADLLLSFIQSIESANLCQFKETVTLARSTLSQEEFNILVNKRFCANRVFLPDQASDNFFYPESVLGYLAYKFNNYVLSDFVGVNVLGYLLSNNLSFLEEKKLVKVIQNNRAEHAKHIKDFLQEANVNSLVKYIIVNINEFKICQELARGDASFVSKRMLFLLGKRLSDMNIRYEKFWLYDLLVVSGISMVFYIDEIDINFISGAESVILRLFSDLEMKLSSTFMHDSANFKNVLSKLNSKECSMDYNLVDSARKIDVTLYCYIEITKAHILEYIMDVCNKQQANKDLVVLGSKSLCSYLGVDSHGDSVIYPSYESLISDEMFSKIEEDLSRKNLLDLSFERNLSNIFLQQEISEHSLGMLFVIKKPLHAYVRDLNNKCSRHLVRLRDIIAAIPMVKPRNIWNWYADRLLGTVYKASLGHSLGGTRKSVIIKDNEELFTCSDIREFARESECFCFIDSGWSETRETLSMRLNKFSLANLHNQRCYMSLDEAEEHYVLK